MKLGKLIDSHIIILFVLLFLYVNLVSCDGKKEQRTINFPKHVEKVSKMPAKGNFWIFILAGQSNMAGRGFVEPQDTIPDRRVFSLNNHDIWVLAKEPLHYYEPEFTGLDCGLSFGKALSKCLPDSVYIGLIPCAVGASSVEQWLGDSLFRGVRLKTNFSKKVIIAEKYGTIQGIIWHQGENNTYGRGVTNYKSSLYNLFKEFRQLVGNDSLPIIMGELGQFLNQDKFMSYPDSINYILREISQTDPSIGLVSTADLEHKGDSLHFNSKSLRILGKRYAEKYFSIIESSEQKSK